MNHLPTPRVDAPIHQVSSRFGTPPALQFSSDEAQWAYVAACNRIRNELPAGQSVVAPRCSLSTRRGSPLEAGAPVTAEELGEGVKGLDRLEDLIFSGHVLRSERQTAEELASIAEHVEHVREMNSAFIGESVSAKMDKLMEQGSK
jgi:hypothetical protein